MRAPKLIQHLKADTGSMSEQLFEKIRNSRKCSDLVFSVAAEEHKGYAMGVYHDLVEWLEAETDSSIEHRYISLGKLRARQGVPFSNMFWAVRITREYLWDYIQQECLLNNRLSFGEE